MGFPATAPNPSYNAPMLFALLGLQESPVLPAQPSVIEVVGYQRVQHALPDGHPDLAAKDNFYIRTHSTYYLFADSDTLPSEADGTRTVKLPKFDIEECEQYKVEGRESKELAAMFKEVTPMNGKSTKLAKVGRGWLGEVDQPVGVGQRILIFRIHTVSEQVETHALGRRKSTRRHYQSHWGGSIAGTPNHKPFVPRIEKMAWFEAGSGLFEPPTYGYGEFQLPSPDRPFTTR